MEVRKTDDKNFGRKLFWVRFLRIHSLQGIQFMKYSVIVEDKEFLCLSIQVTLWLSYSSFPDMRSENQQIGIIKMQKYNLLEGTDTVEKEKLLSVSII